MARIAVLGAPGDALSISHQPKGPRACVWAPGQSCLNRAGARFQKNLSVAAGFVGQDLQRGKTLIMSQLICTLQCTECLYRSVGLCSRACGMGLGGRGTSFFQLRGWPEGLCQADRKISQWPEAVITPRSPDFAQVPVTLAFQLDTAGADWLASVETGRVFKLASSEPVPGETPLPNGRDEFRFCSVSRFTGEALCMRPHWRERTRISNHLN